jgi:hypothetical protein
MSRGISGFLQVHVFAKLFDIAAQKLNVMPHELDFDNHESKQSLVWCSAIAIFVRRNASVSENLSQRR